MNRPEDRELAGYFRALRAEEARSTPAFAMPSLPVPRHRRGRGVAASLVAAAAVGALAIMMRPPSFPERIGPLDLGETWWESPTDFLLLTPGIEMIKTVPVIGLTQTVASNQVPETRDDTLDE